MPNFNAIDASTKLVDCLIELMLISNSHSDAHRLAVLAAAASTSVIEDLATVTKEQLLQFISQCAVASVLKRCKGKRIDGNYAINSNNGHVPHNRFNGNGNFKHRNKLTKEQHEQKTMKSPFAID